MIYVLLGLAFIPSFFLWTAIHEVSHWLTARKLVNAKLIKMKLIPSYDLGHFTWAYVRYRAESEPTNEQSARISLAPWWADGVAVLLFPFTALMPGIWGFVAAIVLLGGIIDLAHGSLRRDEFTDIHKAASKLKDWSLAEIRIYGLLAVGYAIVSYLTLAFII